ncbi:adenylate kinase family protein [Sporocytophaga myxococcoides]|uniref:adenylate kinase family protein n=1 Tax=Sporocytophaga myxococcoides TaxID=153721 RepID=UPI000409F24D|nr:nucleoside monophosphate kinase [Sporocytophaga myxococcoides]
MKILVITGPPYSGKGTQCEVLKNELGFRHISTGDRIRLEKEQKTEFGIIASEYDVKGDLVPDSIMKALLGRIVDENIKEKGIILDGYPRTVSQVDTLIDLLKEKGMLIDQVINIEVPKDELLIRAKKRAETSDRIDDKNPQTHFKRINIFESTTRPAIEYMKPKLNVISIDGSASIEEITE